MSGKTGRKPTGRKPVTVARQSAKTDGAFGKETADQIRTGDLQRNLDKAVRQRESRSVGGQKKR